MKNIIINFVILAYYCLVLITSIETISFAVENKISKLIISDETIEIQPSVKQIDINQEADILINKFQIRNKKAKLSKEIQIPKPLKELYGYILYQPLPELIGIRGCLLSDFSSIDILDIKDGKSFRSFIRITGIVFSIIKIHNL